MERENRNKKVVYSVGVALSAGILSSACTPKQPIQLSEDGCPDPSLSCQLEYQRKGEGFDLRSLNIVLDSGEEILPVEIDLNSACGQLGFVGEVEIDHCTERLAPSRPCVNDDHFGDSRCSKPDWDGIWSIKLEVRDGGTLFFAGKEIPVVDVIAAFNSTIGSGSSQDTLVIRPTNDLPIEVQPSSLPVEIKSSNLDRAGFWGTPIGIGVIIVGVAGVSVAAYLINQIINPRFLKEQRKMEKRMAKAKEAKNRTQEQRSPFLAKVAEESPYANPRYNQPGRVVEAMNAAERFRAGPRVSDADGLTADDFSKIPSNMIIGFLGEYDRLIASLQGTRFVAREGRMEERARIEERIQELLMRMTKTAVEYG